MNVLISNKIYSMLCIYFYNMHTSKMILSVLFIRSDARIHITPCNRCQI